LHTRSLLRSIAALLFGGVTAASCLISYYLTQLDRGVARNVQAAEALVEAQRAIQDRNVVLTEMVAATDRIGQGMERLTNHSQQIHQQIEAMAAANRVTLELNQALEESNAVTPAELRRVLASVRSMNASAASIRDYMSDLRNTAAQDVDRLKAISAITARMNTRTPGW